MATLKSKLADQYVLLMDAQNKYVKGHPELSLAQSRVDELLRQIKTEMGKHINLDSSYANLRYNIITDLRRADGVRGPGKGLAAGAGRLREGAVG